MAITMDCCRLLGGDMELNKVFGLEEYSYAYEFATNNSYQIKEIERDELGNRKFQVVKIMPL